MWNKQLQCCWSINLSTFIKWEIILNYAFLKLMYLCSSCTHITTHLSSSFRLKDFWSCKPKKFIQSNLRECTAISDRYDSYAYNLLQDIIFGCSFFQNYYSNTNRRISVNNCITIFIFYWCERSEIPLRLKIVGIAKYTCNYYY